MYDEKLGWSEVGSDISFSALENEIATFFKENKKKPIAILIYVLNLRHSVDQYTKLCENEKEQVCNMAWNVLEWLKRNTNLGSGLKSNIPLWYSSESEWKSFRDGFFK